ncbi:MAG: heavy metal translocating P-type ATPase [Myxococcota bacterium]
MSAEATWTFDVRGMHCASCVARVEKTLRAQPGVRDATVNLASERARLIVDERADADAIRDALDREGYPLDRVEAGAEASDPAARLAEEARRWRGRAGVAAALSAPVMVLAMGGFDSPAARLAQAALASWVVLHSGRSFHRGALAALRRRRADMDTLVSLGTAAAYAASIAALLWGGPLYFETACAIITFILVGRSLEARARGRAGEAVSLLVSRQARNARVRRGDDLVEVHPDALLPGDRLVVGPGERIAADAVVQEGRSAIDESWLSGEFLPVDKGPGDWIHAGSVNGNGVLAARVERPRSDGTLARIVRAVEQAQGSKAPVEHLVDRVAAVFVPAVLAIAALTFVGTWTLAGQADIALARAVAVLVIACPCALGLATPTAIIAGSGRGAELGVLFRTAGAFERARRIDTLVFDKTGTLTEARMELAGLEAEGDADGFLERVAAVEAATGHPIGEAVARAASARRLDRPEVADLAVEPGLGARGRVAGEEVFVGRPGWLAARGLELDPRLRHWLEEEERAGRTAFGAGWRGRVRGGLSVSDTLRPEAAAAVGALGERGIRVEMVTGDAAAPAAAVARATGIAHFKAGARPEEKLSHLSALQEAGRTVAFVGDGINDAPALAQADLGLAVGSGSEIAVESGDAVLLSGRPDAAVTAIDLARRTHRIIAQNLFWAFAYNTAAIPVAAAGGLDPMWAAAAMATSSVSVVLNSLRLRRSRAFQSGTPAASRGTETLESVETP